MSPKRPFEHLLQPGAGDDPGELLPPLEVTPVEPLPLPVTAPREPRPPERLSPPPMPPPAPDPPRPPDPARLEATRKALAQAEQALSPWKEVVLTPEPPIATRQELLYGVGFALVTACLGFMLTNDRLAGLSRAAARLDRRLAEAPPPASGHAQVQFQAPDAGEPLGSVVFSGPPPTADSTVHPVLVPDLDQTDLLPVAPTATATPTPATRPSPSAIADHGSGADLRPVLPPAPPSRWPPMPEPRADETTPETAWQRVFPAMVRVQGPTGDAVSGVIVDPGGLVATRWSAINGLSKLTVQTSQGAEQADLLGGISGTDLALLRLPAGTWPAVTLAPEAPDPDKPLAFASARGGFSVVQKARFLGSAATTGEFRFAAVLGPADAGNVLVNARGEVAAVVLGKSAGFPGNANSLAADMSVLWPVLQHKDDLAATGDAELFNQQFRSALAQVLPSADAQGAPGTDVIPGLAVGMYRLGLPTEALQKLLGTIEDPVPLNESGWSELRQPSAGLDFTLADGRVVAVRTTNPQFTTRQGVGVGAVTVNIDLSVFMQDEGPAGDLWLMRPGMDLWANREGKVTSLVVEPGPH